MKAERLVPDDFRDRIICELRDDILNQCLKAADGIYPNESGKMAGFTINTLMNCIGKMYLASNTKFDTRQEFQELLIDSFKDTLIFWEEKRK